MKRKMELGLYLFGEVDEEWLIFVNQLGVEAVVMANPRLPGDGRWEFIDLLQMRTAIEMWVPGSLPLRMFHPFL